MSLTLVTCWWDLERRGSNRVRDFETLSRPVLALPLPMVVFCDPWLAEKIQSGRPAGVPTHVISMEFEQLETYGLLFDRIKTCELPTNRNMGKDTPLFLTMGWSKPWMLKHAAETNPFETSHFAWVDIGIQHALTHEDRRQDDSLARHTWEPVPDPMHFHMLRYPGNAHAQPDYYQQIHCYVAAGFMTGSQPAVVAFADAYYREAQQVLASGRASIDEDLMAVLLSRNPEAYLYSLGNYDMIFTNYREPVGGLDYIRWLCADARNRGYPEWAANVEQRLRTRDILRLHMMVKDEARRIRETLESVRPWITSWSILDTGSTDGTQAIIREVLAGIPGTLHERPFVPYADTGIIDFAASRNLGLDLAGTDAAWLLLLNGDDVLHEGASLREFATAQLYSDADAWHFNIKGDGGPDFVYPRLVRSTAGWRYTMPTHEIISGARPVAGTVPGAWIWKGADPEAVRHARWKRDVVVLDRWLRDHQDDHRTLFYLAQTRECLSNFGDTGERIEHLTAAHDLYLRRSELGGWPDEVFESGMRAANLAERLRRPWPEIQDLFLKAFAAAPNRAEPLSRIAQHWLNANCPAAAYVFASRASEIPLPPPGPLSADPSVYEVTIPDQLSRSAFYCGQRDRGREGARKASRARPDDGNLRRNFHFYTRPLHDLVGSYQQIDIVHGWPEIPGWVYTTPSVCHVKDKTYAIVRAVNYRIRPDGSYDYDGTIRTRNFWSEFSADLGTNLRQEIVDAVSYERTPYPVEGYEDCRLTWWENAFWVTANVRNSTHGTEGLCVQMLLRMDGQRFVDMVPLSLEYPGHQKNWKPFVRDNGDLRWIYSTDPLCVVGDAEQPEPAQHSGRLLGSSQAIRLEGGLAEFLPPALRSVPGLIQNGGWLWVDHEVSYNAQGRDRVYVHRLVLGDHELKRVIAMSDPFCFRKLGIEFCAGLAPLWGPRGLALETRPPQLVLSYSVFDSSSELAVIPLEGALKILDLR